MRSAQHRTFRERVLQLPDVAFRKENAVVVLLAKHIILHDRFERAERVPPGELIQHIIVERGREFAAEHAGKAHGRRLRQLTPFRNGERLIRHEKVQRKADSDDKHKGCAEDPIF